MRAIIFDFDGVLVDSEPLHEWAIRESVATRNWTFTHQQFVDGIVGRGDERAFVSIARWNNAPLSDDLAHELLTRKRALMAEGIAQGRYTVQPGAPEAVALAAASVPLAVCSGSRASVVVTMLKAIGLHHHFRAITTADDVERPKPFPDGYLHAAAALGIPPADCLAIEDTPTGIDAAKRAGMRVIALCHTCPAPALAAADHTLHSIADLPAHLAR
jgi:HAD superfamily hydrolase (TIGR01509 family)